ncbi:hypothetical protein TNCV_918341 [Trichonephila clavipes]|nr:hypothetical protein TNCV_918341 [Trichonephila clavipes]
MVENEGFWRRTTSPGKASSSFIQTKSVEGAPHSKKPTKEYLFQLELLQPCSKKDPVTLRQKGLETIAILSQDIFAIAYTDGSSDRSLSNGGAGIILLLPDGNNYKHTYENA